MTRTILAAIVFIVVFVIALGIMQFIIHIAGAIVKLGLGAVIALIAAGIAFAVAESILGGRKA